MSARLPGSAVEVIARKGIDFSFEYPIVVCSYGANRSLVTTSSPFQVSGVGRPPNVKRSIDQKPGQLHSQSFRSQLQKC